MTSLLEPAQSDRPAPLAEALDEVRRSAQSLLADLGDRPRALRIRAGDVVVEMEWTEQQRSAATAVVAAAPDAPPEPKAAPVGSDISAPIVGTFYRAPEPGAAPFVSEGDQVHKGQQVGIVEAMKLMIPVEAETDGRIVAAIAADGAPVEFGEPLFRVEPSAQ
ncbi:biotin/lipoyl-containing protein [Asanoa sp. NPDC049573]|uniref:acetyl-CoA carboxylase biotin carboxyl carrier protein n=1 Tax=Asanoa sp. NPDC049573 TaxID=3155396 RepID=UPI003444A36C